MIVRSPRLSRWIALAGLGASVAISCGPPRDAQPPVAAAEATAPDAAAAPVDAGEVEAQAPPPEPSVSAAAAATAPPPAWASGSVSDRLFALRVTDENWARRDLVTWTTPAQVDTLRASKALLVATAYTRGPPSPFVWIVSKLSRHPGPDGAIAGMLSSDSRFAKRRYAWSAGYATVLGLGSKRYGTELVAVRLREDALVVGITPERDPQISVRDLQQREIPLDQAVAQAARIGAVYHVRTGKDVPSRFREYVLVNEAEIERWAVGTPDLHAEVAAEAALLGDLARDLGSTPPDPAARGPFEAWRRVDPTSPIRALWEGSIAFQIDRYRLDAARVGVAVDALEDYDRAAPALEVKP